MFTALAENIDDMTSKINIFIALAPITYIGGSHNELFKSVSVSLPYIWDFLGSLNINEVFGPDWEQNIHKNQICSWFPEMCLLVVPSGVPGNEFENMFWRRVANARQYQPGSVKMLIHLGEIRVSNEFKQFDYGSDD